MGKALTAFLLIGMMTWGHSAERPNIVLIAVDTLRADRLGVYGYGQQTSPHIDALLQQGQRFTAARTVEPLTAPSMISLLTSRYPHEHGASRNGLTMYPGLPSLPKSLKSVGYRTLAVVGNWTLRTRLTGLIEHFDQYEEMLLRKRWFGMVASESDAVDLTDAALRLLKQQQDDRPFFLWVHYTDPHAPYKAHPETAQQLGLDWKKRNQFTRAQRYDMEVAYTDLQIKRFLDGIARHPSNRETIIVFVSDHGESLGEHNYWGHGRHLYEPSLRVPMAIVWPGKIKPGIITTPASLLDVAPTILGLLAIEAPTGLAGVNWASVFSGKHPADPHRKTYHQAHRGVVMARADKQKGRERGLLELAVVVGNDKETFRVKNRVRRLFHLLADPAERVNTVHKKSPVSPEMRLWALQVEEGLHKINKRHEALSSSDLEMLRSLGYID